MTITTITSSGLDLSTEYNNVIPLQTQTAKGLVVFDNLHENDYVTDLEIAKLNLENLGYLVKYTSDFTSWSEAVSKATYLVMTPIYTDISPSEIQAVVDWFTNTAGNLLLASRGDFNAVNFQGMNDLLSNLTVTARIQDDNVYTTNPSARQDWYVESQFFNLENHSSIFQGVYQMNFFSPSSILDTQNSEVLVYAEPAAYQTDQAGSTPLIIYDNTNDGVGGDAIPLSVLETVQLGSDFDRVILTGTTLWSDFDYGDPDNDDTTYFKNIVEYFEQATIDELGDITIDIPDTDSPKVKIDFPHNEAFVKGSININISAIDAFGVSSIQIFIDDELLGTGQSVVWDTTQSIEGQHTIRVDVEDHSGNVGSTTHIYFVDQDFEPQLSAQPKIMTYNVKQSGAFSNWIDVLKEENADLMILVETGDFDNNDNELLISIQDQLNNYFFDEIAYQSYTLQDISRNYDGIAILTRFNIVETNKIDYVTRDDGVSIGVPLPFLHVTVDFMNELIHIMGAHLSAGPSSAQARNNQAEGILNFMDRELVNKPIIFLGDFNGQSPEDVSEANSELGTQAIDMIINPSNPKSSQIHTFTDVHKFLNPSDPGISYTTFPGRIDYIFVNQFFKDYLVSSTTGDTFSALIGSDHLSVDLILDLTNFEVPTSFPSTTNSNEDRSNSPNPVPISNIFITIIIISGMLRVNKKNKPQSA